MSTLPLSSPGGEVVARAQALREHLTAFGVPASVEVTHGPGSTQVNLSVERDPFQPLVTLTVSEGEQGVRFCAELHEGTTIDAPPAGEWELSDERTTAALARLAWLGPDVVESTRTRLDLPEASIADLAVAIAAAPEADDPWGELAAEDRPGVVVYSSRGCVACTATKRQLDKSAVPYTEVDVRTDQRALDELKALGYLELPVVVDGDQHWSGYRPDRVATLVTKYAPPAPVQASRPSIGLEGPGV